MVRTPFKDDTRVDRGKGNKKKKKKTRKEETGNVFKGMYRRRDTKRKNTGTTERRIWCVECERSKTLATTTKKFIVTEVRASEMREEGISQVVSRKSESLQVVMSIVVNESIRDS